MHRAICRAHIALAFASVVVAALALSAGSAAAENYGSGSIEIANPWTRATPKGATVAGAYMTITNKGSMADRLVGLEIEPGETVELKPGSFHVMLTGLKQPLQKGEKIKGTLQFEKAGKIDIEYSVEDVGATMPAMGGHQH